MALLFVAISFPIMAQNNVQRLDQTANPKAKVEVRQGKQCLVLNTGINTSEELSTLNHCGSEKFYYKVSFSASPPPEQPRGLSTDFKDHGYPLY